jgi:protein-serine/threonine kinase
MAENKAPASLPVVPLATSAYGHGPDKTISIESAPPSLDGCTTSCTFPGTRPARTLSLPERIMPESSDELLIDEEGAVAYLLGRTVSAALMGCVRSATRMSRVGEAWHSCSDTPAVVVKQLDKRCIIAGKTTSGELVREDTKREIELLRIVASIDPAHPNVVRLVDVLENSDFVYIVLTACVGGELFDAALGPHPLSEETVRDLSWQLVRGALYLHGLGFCHRDISLENVMLSDSPMPVTLKIIDMGLSTRLSPTGSVTRDGCIGKTRYCAPEVFTGLDIEYDGCSADSWQVGICLFAMLFRRFLWDTPTMGNPYIRHLSSGGRLLDLTLQWQWDKLVSADVLDLLDGLLRVDPHERTTLLQAAAHAWFAPCRANEVGL